MLRLSEVQGCVHMYNGIFNKLTMWFVLSSTCKQKFRSQKTKLVENSFQGKDFPKTLLYFCVNTGNMGIWAWSLVLDIVLCVQRLSMQPCLLKQQQKNCRHNQSSVGFNLSCMTFYMRPDKRYIHSLTALDERHQMAIFGVLLTF